MDKDKHNNPNDFDDEERQLVLDFENTVLRGGQQFFDVDEMEVIMDYYLEVNDLEPLQRAVEYAEQLYPRSTSVRLRRAHLLIAREQYEPALKIIRQLRREAPDDTDVAYSLGVAYGAIGEHEKAIELFHEAAADGWMLGRIYANIAEEYYHLQDFDEAIRYYKLALDTDSYDDSTLYNYVDTAIQSGAVEDAIEYFKSFVGEHPYSAEGWHCLGTVYREQGLYELATDAYEYAIAIDKGQLQFYIDLSFAQEMSGQASEAVSTLLRARDISGERNLIYRFVANIYVRIGNNDMAMIYLRKALEENPDDPITLASLAIVLSDDRSAAQPLLRKALRLAPDNIDVLDAAADFYDRVGNFEMANDYFERVVSNDNCNEYMCQRYVAFLYRHKVYDILVQFAEESLDIYPADPFYSTYLAACYYYTDRFNRCSRMLPNCNPQLLCEICPEVVDHPRLGPLVPHHNAP